MWRGAVTFGLVTIPVRLFGATEQHNFEFHLVHRADGGRIRHRRVCEVCGQEVGAEEIARGHQLEDGRLVQLDPEDFERLPLPTERNIEVVEFVSADQVDPIHLHKSYYLEPERAAVQPYLVLRDALERAWRLAIVKITIRRRETLAVVRPRGGVLVLQTLLWPDEIREPWFEFLSSGAEPRRQEVRMAMSLVNGMTGRFDPGQFTDDYREAMERLIAAKSSGADIPAARAPEETGGMDLLTALRRSLEEVRATRGDPEH